MWYAKSGICLAYYEYLRNRGIREQCFELNDDPLLHE